MLEVQRDPAYQQDGATEVASPFRLLGQYADDETGLCYTRFRYFDAEAGRWCSPDPLGVAGGANLLAFDGSPSKVVDPLGLACGGPTITKGRIILRLLMSFSLTGLRATWDIVTGKAKLVLGPAPPGTHKDVKGVQPFGTDEAYVYTDRVSTNLEAAGVAAHEVTHVQQKLTQPTYRKIHEVEAFKAQRDVDSNLAGWTDQQIEDHVNTHQVYQHVPP